MATDSEGWKRAAAQRDRALVILQEIMRSGLRWDHRARVQEIMFEVAADADKQLSIDKRLARRLQKQIHRTLEKIKYGNIS